jgi:hypothetical protein
MTDEHHCMSQQLMAYLLDCAFSGGSTYWATDIRNEEYLGASFLSEIPMTGGSCEIFDGVESTWLLLSATAFESGAQAFREKYRRHWIDAMAGQFDATTGDVFLQCCLFGETKYG